MTVPRLFRMVLLMQTSMTFAVDNRLPEILDRLRALFPAKPNRITDPLSQLVFAVAAEDAAPAVGLAVYNRLRAKFPRWSDLRDASDESVVKVLIGVPGAARKARVLPAILRVVEAERGVIELDFLRRMDTAAATRWLERLPGVGPGIAAAVLSFSDLERPVLQVGKENARPIRRLALSPASAPLSALPRHVAERAPTDWRAREFADLGRGMSRLARTVCVDAKPDCKACPLRDLCPSAGRKTAEVVAFPGAKAAPQVRTVRSARS